MANEWDDVMKELVGRNPQVFVSFPKPVYRTRFRNGRVTQWFSYDQIKLWELPPDVFEQSQLTGLLPLLPLTENGQNYETVDRMIDKMVQAGRQDLLWLAKDIAGLVLKSEQAKRWIRERFRPMLPDILKESWVYQETVEEGRKVGIEEGRKVGWEEGQEEAKKQDIIRFVEIRFSALLAVAKQAVEQKKSLDQLQVMLDKLYQANTVEEAQEALLPNS